MPDTIERPDMEDEDDYLDFRDRAIAELRDAAIRTAGFVTGDTQVARLRPIVLLMISALAVTFAPARARVAGILAIVLAAHDAGRRR